MGHYLSDFQQERTEFCGWEHPHTKHYDCGSTYTIKLCPGFQPEIAREYKEIKLEYAKAWICDDCSGLVKAREKHDAWHDKIDSRSS